jgi:hypothetical protein
MERCNPTLRAFGNLKALWWRSRNLTNPRSMDDKARGTIAGWSRLNSAARYDDVFDDTISVGIIVCSRQCTD